MFVVAFASLSGEVMSHVRVVAHLRPRSSGRKVRRVAHRGSGRYWTAQCAKGRTPPNDYHIDTVPLGARQHDRCCGHDGRRPTMRRRVSKAIAREEEGCRPARVSAHASCRFQPRQYVER